VVQIYEADPAIHIRRGDLYVLLLLILLLPLLLLPMLLVLIVSMC